MKSYNKTNFFKHTYCVFTEVSPEELPKGKPNYTSKSNSAYYFTETGVYRKSDHWGRAANCRWKLNSKKYQSQANIIAYANWTDFFPNNENEKLFFIRIDQLNQVNYYHKNEKLYNNSDILRSAVDTSKRIKLINQVLENDKWSKYIEFEDFDKLKKNIIEQILYSNKSFSELKKNINGKT